MNFDAVIFDFDGVIIDSKHVQRIAFSESYCSVYRKDPRHSLFEEFLSHAGDSLENIFTKMGLSLEMVKPYRAISRKNIDSIILNEKLVNIIKVLNEDNIKIGLCTGKDRLRTEEVLRFFNIDILFDGIICSDDVVHPKPHPESLETLINQFGVKRNKTLMVGDAVNDIVCAKRAQTFSAGVLWGETSEEVLIKTKPDFIFSKVSQLNDLLIYNGELLK
jgi:HAD superfamily hydrolase (TIGR01549 family)